VAQFYEAARPLVEETIGAAEDLLRDVKTEFEALYVTGGGSELPLVARVLRERFGRRVRRSAYTRSATAIGLAIQADQPDSYKLSDRLSRFFGVWREADCGSRIIFDPLFQKGAVLPSPGEPLLSIRREYSPVHNVGHFRFLECSHRTGDGVPTGEVTLWDEIRFPFDPSLQGTHDLSSTRVEYSGAATTQHIEEHYECDGGGAITVTVANQTSGYTREYHLGRWSQRQEIKPIKSVARRRKAAGSGASAGD
jgi:hypothetical protein